MKKMKTPMIVAFLALSAMTFLIRCGTETEAESALSTYNNANLPPDSLCFAQPSWFPHSQTPAPMEGDGSPFDTNSTTNQIFHQWSWQKFLWLTKPDAGGAPLFLNQNKVYQVTNTMMRITPQAGTLLTLTDTAQAGTPTPYLHSNPDFNNGTGSIVFYSLHMNPIMFGAGRQFAQQIASHYLADSNDASFPVGSFEMKVSWIPVSAIPTNEQSNYFTTMAAISRDGGVTYTNTTVAMLGLHVVGVVKNHPEFIWATFEHDDLSPSYDWTNNKATSANNQLLFKTGTVSGIDGIVFNTATNLGKTPYQVFDLFQYGVPRNPGGGFMETSQSEPVNFNNIDGINKCVKSQLDDVWKNYFYNGSIWLNMDGRTLETETKAIDSLGFGIGSATKGSLARGSVNCANVTMESFYQTFNTNITQIKASNLANCFSCHFSPSNPDPQKRSPLYLSHTFQDYLGTVQKKSKEEIQKSKEASEKQVMLRMMKK